MGLTKIGYEGVDYIHLAQDQLQATVNMVNELSGSIRQDIS
jgi:hypothetical protein